MKKFITKNQYQLKGFLETPVLWNSGEFYGIKQFSLPDVSPCPTQINDKYNLELDSTHVLGKRAEIFFEIGLHSSGEYRVLASRLQISKGKITIGELDFVLQKEKTNEIYHVEVVYKFYVYDPSFTKEMQRWIGPNRKDSLLRKVDKLKNHQLPLLHNKETISTLTDLGIEIYNAEQKVFFPANLFIPKNFNYANLPFINPQCITGYWIHRKDFTDKNYSGCLFFTPKKQDWPILPQLNDIWFSFDEIVQQVDQLLKVKKAPLIWMKSAGGTFERFFVVWW